MAEHATSLLIKVLSMEACRTSNLDQLCASSYLKNLALLDTYGPAPSEAAGIPCMTRAAGSEQLGLALITLKTWAGRPQLDLGLRCKPRVKQTHMPAAL